MHFRDDFEEIQIGCPKILARHPLILGCQSHVIYIRWKNHNLNAIDKIYIYSESSWNSEHILTGNIICIFSRFLYIRSQSLALLGAFSILKETSYKLHHLKRPKKATQIFIFGNFCGLDHQIFINIHVHNNQLFLRQKLQSRE